MIRTIRGTDAADKKRLLEVKKRLARKISPAERAHLRAEHERWAEQ